MDKPIGNIYQNEFDEIWNSAETQEIRSSIFDETFRFCNHDRCPHIVSDSLSREAQDPKFAKLIEKKPLELAQGPQLLSLNYDFTCNLSCPSCREEVRGMEPDKQDRLITFQNNLLKSDLIRNARRLTVTGAGEPFASKVFMNLFSKINRKDLPNIKVTLRTNGLLLTPSNWTKIKNMHYAVDMISISVDAATKETYQSVRRGGNFDRLLKNLYYIRGLKKTHQFKIKFNFVVQRGNYREMPQFVQFARRFDCDRVAFTKIINLGTFDQEEYNNIGIHLPDHPEYPHFQDILNHPDLQDPVVRIRNISADEE
jgi:sulfatase maturation enzyme AslB (radical SAM superfamily)